LLSPHILQGGYSSGYYSYKWAEFWMQMPLIIFKKGFFDREVATKFRENVLSKGETEHQ
jgi:peptidyl-dipeptidase Dcp